MPAPTVTIVTITFNNLSGLEKTLRSVANLTYKNVQHLIIDGASTDGTLELLSQYSAHAIQFISELDKGIYDAMNKGIQAAKSEWTIFMNSGDIFAHLKTLNRINFISTASVIYGSSRVRYEDDFIREMEPQSISEIWKGMSFTHQSVFVRTKLLKELEFDLNYHYCADFNQLFQLYKTGHEFEQLEQTICEIEAGGISDNQRYLATNEVYKINRKLAPRFSKHFYFVFRIVTEFLVVKIKEYLPKKLRSNLLKRKYN